MIEAEKKRIKMEVLREEALKELAAERAILGKAALEIATEAGAIDESEATHPTEVADKKQKRKRKSADISEVCRFLNRETL